MQARELWFTGPGEVELREGAIPRVAEGELLVSAIASGISQGTELLLYSGNAPTPFEPDLDAPGQPTYPRRYGYAWVGEVVDRARDVTQFAVGERVFGLLPHGDWHHVGVDRVHRIADEIPAERAVLAANLETAVNCIWDGNVSIGDVVVILGAGVVGLLLTHLAHRLGAEVRVIEPSAKRRQAAMTLGATSAVEPQAGQCAADADIVFEVTGDPASLDSAFRYAALEATIVVVSFYGERLHPIRLGEDFHRRRLTLRSSQVSHIPAAKSPRWTKSRRFALVRQLLKDPVLDVLIEQQRDIEQARDTYLQLAQSPTDALQVVFEY